MTLDEAIDEMHDIDDYAADESNNNESVGEVVRRSPVAATLSAMQTAQATIAEQAKQVKRLMLDNASWESTCDAKDDTITTQSAEIERLKAAVAIDALDTIQRELAPWQEHNFPGRSWQQPFMGVVEEVGELSHSLLKQQQEIRGTYEDHERNAKDAVADITVFLADLCNARGWNMKAIVEQTWAKVKQRDWRATREAAIAAREGK